MNKNLVELVFLVDRSNSMRNITVTVITAFKEFIGHHSAAPGDANISIYTFDNHVDRVMFRELLKNEYTQKTIETNIERWFSPRYTTALYDAMGRAITEIGETLSLTPEENRPAKVIIITLTDGYENTSQTYSQETIRRLVAQQRTQYNWDFIFIGANQDAVLTAKDLDIPISQALTFCTSKNGTKSALESLTRSTLEVRQAYSSFNGVGICSAQAEFNEEDRKTALDGDLSALKLKRG